MTEPRTAAVIAEHRAIEAVIPSAPVRTENRLTQADQRELRLRGMIRDGLTLRAMGAAMGVSATTICRWMRDARLVPVNMHRVLAEARSADIAQRRHDGQSVRTIAAGMGVSMSQVGYVIRRDNLPRRVHGAPHRLPPEQRAVYDLYRRKGFRAADGLAAALAVPVHRATP